MLIRYKKNHEKIAMGLLSFMPEVKKDVKKLQQTIKDYEQIDHWHLHLWKEDDDVLGAIGVQILDETSLVIQHISVNPSHRNSGIGQKMIREIQRIYGNKYEITPTEEIQNFFKKCIDSSEVDSKE
ncbi:MULTISPECIES: GNAT family N-acetyltransferase [Oceanobacillus]|uniref:Protein RibT n=1 Tax=Oceanobacillus kimchii TaxID=746691 RepID=A0ABQ5TLL6_9BACI|nr:MULTISPECIES: GNAT family N-acetyltransferase [Oceanobacillus]MBT2598418.1 GNAT family N-acetyltransferase [Oceanobacillus sp. ISL-74]MBT2651336.1 GNAT family N-acetyltransferase [Oceanobacillus sp. ISL-73]OEH55732.1 reductase [Oceanobacillus sp. E9]GLO66484.1 protein RibT [Oceanobacillus kimchii]